MQGTVKRYVEERGFGFIKPDEPDESGNYVEVFVHIRAVRSGALAKNARVDYDLGKDFQGRPRAEKVRVLDGFAEPPAPEVFDVENDGEQE